MISDYCYAALFEMYSAWSRFGLLVHGTAARMKAKFGAKPQMPFGYDNNDSLVGIVLEHKVNHLIGQAETFEEAGLPEYAFGWYERAWKLCVAASNTSVLSGKIDYLDGKLAAVEVDCNVRGKEPYHHAPEQFLS